MLTSINNIAFIALLCSICSRNTLARYVR